MSYHNDNGALGVDGIIHPRSRSSSRAYGPHTRHRHHQQQIPALARRPKHSNYEQIYVDKNGRHTSLRYANIDYDPSNVEDAAAIPNNKMSRPKKTRRPLRNDSSSSINKKKTSPIPHRRRVSFADECDDCNNGIAHKDEIAKHFDEIAKQQQQQQQHQNNGNVGGREARRRSSLSSSSTRRTSLSSSASSKELEELQESMKSLVFLNKDTLDYEHDEQLLRVTKNRAISQHGITATTKAKSTKYNSHF